jgi:hypothetical protein
LKSGKLKMSVNSNRAPGPPMTNIAIAVCVLRKVFAI